MNAEVHPREGNEHTKCDRSDAQGAILEFQSKTAEKTDRGLCVTAWKGISACRLARALPDREIGVEHPGAGDAAGDLQKLVENGSRKADGEQEIPPAL